MTLNEWSAQSKRVLYDDLIRGNPPSAGTYDHDLLREAKSKGQPQMGTTVYAPGSARFEFIYKDHVSTIVVSVTVPSPERIVFLPVPSWVVETIWQGDVDGSFHFESDAKKLVAEFVALLEPESNPALFGPKPATRRE